MKKSLFLSVVTGRDGRVAVWLFRAEVPCSGPPAFLRDDRPMWAAWEESGPEWVRDRDNRRGIRIEEISTEGIREIYSTGNLMPNR